MTGSLADTEMDIAKLASSFYSPLCINEADLKEFIVTQGGSWNEANYIHQGSLYRNEVQTQLVLDSDVLKYTEGVEWKAKVDRWGFVPKSLIILGMFRYDGTQLDQQMEVMIRDVGRQLEQQWLGVVDWND